MSFRNGLKWAQIGFEKASKLVLYNAYIGFEKASKRAQFGSNLGPIWLRNIYILVNAEKYGFIKIYRLNESFRSWFEDLLLVCYSLIWSQIGPKLDPKYEPYVPGLKVQLSFERFDSSILPWFELFRVFSLVRSILKVKWKPNVPVLKVHLSPEKLKPRYLSWFEPFRAFFPVRKARKLAPVGLSNDP